MDLPKGWAVSNFEDTVEILDSHREPINNTERSKRIEGKRADELYPYYGATGLVGYIDGYLLEGEYVLLGEDGAPFLDGFVSKAYLVKGKIWVNNHAHVLLSKLSNKFLCYYLNAFAYKGFVSGTTRLKLTQGSMKQMPVILPPLAEQHRIVAKIDALFSELDKGVETLQTIRHQLRTYRQAVLKWAFDKKGFEYRPLSELGDLGRGKSKHRPRNDPRLFSDGKYPFIQTSEVKAANGKIKKYTAMYGDFGLKQSKLWPVGTLCITIAANIADTAFLGVEACFPDSVVGFTANKELVLPKYVDFFIQSAKQMLWYYAPATAQKNINLNTLENLSVPYCSLDEQAQIVADIESRLSVCDKLESIIDENLAKATTLRQSILKKAFAGRLVPQDPNDEPADKLLERIKAAKLAAMPTNKPAITRRKKKNG